MYFQTYRLIFSIYAGQNVNVPHSGIPSSCAQDYVFSHCVLCRAAPPTPSTLLSLKWVATIPSLDARWPFGCIFSCAIKGKKCRKHLFSLEKNLHLYKGLILFGKKEEERKKNEQVFPPKMLCTVASKEILNLSKLNIPPVISPYSTSTSDCTFYFRWTWTSFECRLDHIQILVSSNPTSFKSCTKTSRYVHFISTCTQ